jgi:hypothetical protein
MTRKDDRFYVRLAVDFFDHPKVLAAGRDAWCLYIVALTWSRQLLTDGAVDARSLRLLAFKAGLGIDEAQKAADALVDARLWERTADGWTIHDYAAHQLTSDDIERVREGNRERQARYRQARSTANPSRPDNALLTRPESESETESETEKSSSSEQPDFTPLAALGIGTTTTSLKTDPRADRALRTYASRMATGKDDPRAYALRIVNNGTEHLDRLNALARQHPQLDPDELADLYLTERRPTKTAATTCVHCGGPRHAPGTGPCPTLLADPGDAA